MANTINSLDLYARVEDMLENSEAMETLYEIYFDILSQLPFNSLLDVGCGSGIYLESLQKQFPDVKAKGIDLSPVMIERARAKGVNAEAVDLCELEGKFDVITAVFDMMNYLSPEVLEGFFTCIEEHLNDGGYFMFDINTLYGFENVAVGAYIAEDDMRFLAIDSDFEDERYVVQFTLFEKEGDCFAKSQETIVQYYHTIELLQEKSGMQLVTDQNMALFGFNEADKKMVIFQKNIRE